MDFNKLATQAKRLIDKRGGMASVKGDAEELKDIATSHDSLSDKAKETVEALKVPGAQTPPTGR